MSKTRTKSNIYTKTGDRGETSLFNNERRPKDDLHFEALGDIDELNALIGLYDVITQNEIVSLVDRSNVEKYLNKIQHYLFEIGAHVATPLSSDETNTKKINKTAFDENLVSELEEWIDDLDSRVPKLKNFILPRHPLHLARTVCRRAERKLVVLLRNQDIDPNVLIYMNRLSDFLFVLARFCSQDKEVVYTKLKH